MMSRRKKPAGYVDRLRRTFFPPKGYRRILSYYRIRVLRLAASPYSVAAGVAVGVMSAWTPFLGVHVILALAVAYLVSGNMVAAAIGTTVANPLTLPFMWASTWEVGNLILHSHRQVADKPINLHELFSSFQIWQIWDPVLKPMLIGSVPFALVSGCLSYIAAFYAVRSFQDRRRERLAERAMQARSRFAVDAAAEPVPFP